MNVTQIPIKHFSNRKSGAPIDMIIIHHTALNNSEEVFKIFQNPSKQVSSHYLIDRDGTIYQFVDELKKAWHAGISFWGDRESINDYSIGIELDNNGFEPFSDSQMNSLVKLCEGIMERHPINHDYILAHGDVAPGRKVDPSHLFDWKFLADKGIGFFPEALDYSAKVLHRFGDEHKRICEAKSKLCEIGYHLKGEIDDIYDEHTDTVFKAFKRHYCPQTYSLDGWDTLADARLEELYKHVVEV